MEYDQNKHLAAAAASDAMRTYLEQNKDANSDTMAQIGMKAAEVIQNILSSAPVEPEGEKPTPAVPAKRSVFPDYIICLEDGKKLKLLKPHLKRTYNMTPDEYRARWGLPLEYPMVAPNYAAHRSSLAKKIGLGRRARPEDGAE